MLSMNIVFILYACILFSGAYFGLKAGSKISLIMGISSGLLVLLAMYITTVNHVTGFIFLSVMSGLLMIVFLIRLIKTQKIMPAGILLGASALVLVLTLCQLSKI